MSAPSSTRRPFADDARLELVRGAVREGVGALLNLERVTGSIRVAPRALETLLPDARGTVRELGACFAELASVLAARLAEPIGAVALRGLATTELDLLASALDAASTGTFTVARRLALERVVQGSLPRLDAARTLLDALEDAEFARWTQADPFVLLRDSFHEDLAPEGVVNVTLGGAPAGDRAIRARGLTSLCRLGVAQVAPAGTSAGAHLAVDAEGARITRGRGEGEALAIPRLVVTSALAPCISSMARSLGVRLAHADDGILFGW